MAMLVVARYGDIVLCNLLDTKELKPKNEIHIILKAYNYPFPTRMSCQCDFE